ncbi:MAG: YtxH domain-containing protein [Bryobacteraceae bacterium]
MGQKDSGFGWFVIGIAVGAVVALLYAPKSGKETREFLAKKTEEGRDLLSSTSKEVMDRGRDVVDMGKEYYEKGRELADEAADLFERGRRLVRG